MRIQPLHEPQKSRGDNAKGVRSAKGSGRGVGKSQSSTALQRSVPLPQDWQEHGVDGKRDQVSLSEDARKWQQGDWLDGGLKPGEDPKATAEEVVRNPEFAQQAKKLHKPRVQLREIARKSKESDEVNEDEELANGLPGPTQQVRSAVDPKISMASRHAPLEMMLQRGPQTLNVRGNLALPGGQTLPLTASFEMSEGRTLQAAFSALAG